MLWLAVGASLLLKQAVKSKSSFSLVLCVFRIVPPYFNDLYKILYLTFSSLPILVRQLLILETTPANNLQASGLGVCPKIWLSDSSSWLILDSSVTMFSPSTVLSIISQMWRDFWNFRLDLKPKWKTYEEKSCFRSISNQGHSEHIILQSVSRSCSHTN